MSIRYSGLAIRSFIIGSRLWPPATSRRTVPEPVQQTDGVVDAGRAFVLEGAGNLHVTEPHIRRTGDQSRPGVTRPSIAS